MFVDRFTNKYPIPGLGYPAIEVAPAQDHRLLVPLDDPFQDALFQLRFRKDADMAQETASPLGESRLGEIPP